MNVSATMDEAQVLEVELGVLRAAHRDLDEEIRDLETRASRDLLSIRRLKKRKLVLKDQIARIEDRLLPDIIA